MYLFKSALETLGQTGTAKNSKPLIKVQGIGSDLTNTKALKARGRRKLITNKSVLAQIDIAMERRGF
ncbi:MAG: hypothetical protein IPG12_15775 [Saprospiraceae bacterium]|nr:hypothetical protein [Saprospiraceae bacterium]